MQVQHVINPHENSRTVDRQILMAEKVFLAVAVGITSVGFFVWGRSAASQYIDNSYIQSGIGIAAAVASAFVTDFAFRHFLEEVVFQALKAFHPNITGRVEQNTYFKVMNIVRWIVLSIVVAALFYADWNSVQTIKDPFASSARMQETQDIATASAALSGQLKNASAPMAEQIKALKADIVAAEKRAGSNIALASLASHGNGWAANEIEKESKGNRGESKTTRKTAIGIRHHAG